MIFLAALPPQLDGRIVGGEDADIKDFPHQVRKKTLFTANTI